MKHKRKLKFVLGSITTALTLSGCILDQLLNPETGNNENTIHQVRLSAVVHDGPVSDATVIAYVDGIAKGVATSGSDGAYSIDLADVTKSGLLRIEATKAGGIKLVTIPGSIETLAAKMDPTTFKVDESSLPELSVTNVSTAKVALMKALNGGSEVTTLAKINELAAKVETNSSVMLQMAAAIKTVIDSGIALPDNITDTLDLIDDITSTNSDVSLDTKLNTFVSTNQDAIDTATNDMISDPALTKQLEQIVVSQGFTTEDLSGKTFYVDGGPVVMFNADGSGSAEEVNMVVQTGQTTATPDHQTNNISWSVANGVVTVTSNSNTNTTTVKKLPGSTANVIFAMMEELDDQGVLQTQPLVLRLADSTGFAAGDVTGKTFKARPIGGGNNSDPAQGNNGDQGMIIQFAASGNNGNTYMTDCCVTGTTDPFVTTENWTWALDSTTKKLAINNTGKTVEVTKLASIGGNAMHVRIKITDSASSVTEMFTMAMRPSIPFNTFTTLERYTSSQLGGNGLLVTFDTASTGHAYEASPDSITPPAVKSFVWTTNADGSRTIDDGVKPVTIYRLAGSDDNRLLLMGLEKDSTATPISIFTGEMLNVKLKFEQTDILGMHVMGNTPAGVRARAFKFEIDPVSGAHIGKRFETAETCDANMICNTSSTVAPFTWSLDSVNGVLTITFDSNNSTLTWYLVQEEVLLQADLDAGKEPKRRLITGYRSSSSTAADVVNVFTVGLRKTSGWLLTQLNGAVFETSHTEQGNTVMTTVTFNTGGTGTIAEKNITTGESYANGSFTWTLNAKNRIEFTMTRTENGRQITENSTIHRIGGNPMVEMNILLVSTTSTDGGTTKVFDKVETVHLIRK